MDDPAVRFEVYDITMRTGKPPVAAAVAEVMHRSRDEVLASFRHLADAHMLVLQRDGEILMAGPFSAVPTLFRVTTPSFSTFGNCIWDALGIAATLQSDAQIDTSCADCGSATRLEVRDGNLSGSGFMHFALPPKQWWADVVFT